MAAHPVALALGVIALLFVAGLVLAIRLTTPPNALPAPAGQQTVAGTPGAGPRLDIAAVIAGVVSYCNETDGRGYRAEFQQPGAPRIAPNMPDAAWLVQRGSDQAAWVVLDVNGLIAPYNEAGAVCASSGPR